jgi:hypothetical protein
VAKNGSEVELGFLAWREAVEIGWSDADHRGDRVRELDCLSNDLRVGAEAFFPEAIAQDNRPSAAGTAANVVCGADQAPRYGVIPRT